MDLATFEKAADDGANLELKDPVGNPLLQDDGVTPVTIRLAGVDSPRWTKASDAVQNKVMTTKEKQDAQDMRTTRAGLLAAITLDWSGVVIDGEAIPFSTEAARKLYIRFKWVTDQIDNFISDKKNFLPASSISS